VVSKTKTDNSFYIVRKLLLQLLENFPPYEQVHSVTRQLNHLKLSVRGRRGKVRARVRKVQGLKRCSRRSRPCNTKGARGDSQTIFRSL